MDTFVANRLVALLLEVVEEDRVVVDVLESRSSKTALTRYTLPSDIIGTVARLQRGDTAPAHGQSLDIEDRPSPGWSPRPDQHIECVEPHATDAPARTTRQSPIPTSFNSHEGNEKWWVAWAGP